MLGIFVYFWLCILSWCGKDLMLQHRCPDMKESCLHLQSWQYRVVVQCSLSEMKEVCDRGEMHILVALKNTHYEMDSGSQLEE